MRRIVVFNNVTLDGYFTGRNGDLSWAYGAEPDPQFDAFVAEERARWGSTAVRQEDV